MLTNIDKQKNRPALQKHRILVADDDPAILDAIKMMLEVYDYDVETEADGKVVSKLKQTRPQLLLLDIWMSGTDGREVCKKLKSMADTRNIPVILISASRDIEKSFKDSGANDYLAKPFHIDELLNKIEKNLAN